MQEWKTVQEVLEDMKQKFDDAKMQAGGAEASRDDARNNLDMVKQVQEQKMEEIKRLCRCV